MAGPCVRLGQSRIWLAQGDFEQDAPPCSYVVIDTSDLINDSRSDDFGPMTALAITKFVTAIDNKLARHREKHVVFVADDGSRGLTNAAFLLGAYMVLKHDTEPDEIWSWFQSCNLREYKDGSRSGSRFRLSVLDCWRALDKAKALRWFCWPDKSGCWGAFDPVEYEHYDNPLNGDIHVVVPDRMVAFCGPRHVSGDREYVDDVGAGLRTFSPRYYIDIFEMMKVSTVVRLNQPHYDKREFEEGGFDHLDLQFHDGATPPSRLVRRFFEAVDRSHGVIAVHCSSGLGRTGTVIALFLMRDYGFSAREAMGWLRMIRPGSVVGEQQDFLCGAKWDLNNDFLGFSPRLVAVDSHRALARATSLPDVSRPPAVCTLLDGRDFPVTRTQTVPSLPQVSSVVPPASQCVSMPSDGEAQRSRPGCPDTPRSRMPTPREISTSTEISRLRVSHRQECADIGRSSSAERARPRISTPRESTSTAPTETPRGRTSRERSSVRFASSRSRSKENEGERDERPRQTGRAPFGSHDRPAGAFRRSSSETEYHPARVRSAEEFSRSHDGYHTARPRDTGGADAFQMPRVRVGALRPDTGPSQATSERSTPRGAAVADDAHALLRRGTSADGPQPRVATPREGSSGLYQSADGLRPRAAHQALAVAEFHRSASSEGAPRPRLATPRQSVPAGEVMTPRGVSAAVARREGGADAPLRRSSSAEALHAGHRVAREGATVSFAAATQPARNAAARARSREREAGESRGIRDGTAAAAYPGSASGGLARLQSDAAAWPGWPAGNRARSAERGGRAGDAKEGRSQSRPRGGGGESSRRRTPEPPTGGRR